MRFRRRQRVKLTPKQEVLQAKADKARVLADSLAFGLGEQLKRVDSQEELSMVLEIANGTLFDLLVDVQRKEEAVHPTKRRGSGLSHNKKPA